MFLFSLKKKGYELASLAMALCLGIGVATACDDDAYPPPAKALAPITVMHNGETRSDHLTDVYDHHGGVCAGATLAFRAVQHGMDLLFGEQHSDLDDVVILTLAPGGPMDLLDLIVRGTGPGSRTWPPPGIGGGADKFVFQFMRKSTMQMATVRLKEGLWPADWFILRAKTKEGTISEAENTKRQRDRKNMLDNFTRLNATELFEASEVVHFVAWGAIAPGEIDRHIRDMRRQARAEESGEL